MYLASPAMQEKLTEKNLALRPPIVVVMGHVDHGKTTLLDYIRKTNVAPREAGGITQTISAYEIIHASHESQANADTMQTNAHIPRGSASSPRKSTLAKGKKITFIDTPGHEAFTKMRARGAEVADLAVLVVAADEGMKPQTLEAISILRESNTPFVVAINKIDKAGADIEKTKNALAAAGVLLEGYGGHVSYEPISAKTGQGVDDLLDLILLAAELERHTYDPASPARGYVLEARVDPRRGISATVIVRDGTFRKGDMIATKTARGRVKIIENFLGEPVEQLTPSAPALVIGFETLPEIGDEFWTDATRYLQVPPPAELVPQKPVPIASVADTADARALRLILAAGDRGSLEALSGVMHNLPAEKRPIVVHESVGDISDSDVKLAIGTAASIVGFKTRVNRGARNLAESQKVRIVTSDVIYELVKAIEEFTATRETPSTVGELEVLAIFNQKKLARQVVGGKVMHGVVKSGAAFEIVRALPTAEGMAPGGTDAVPDRAASVASVGEEPRLVGRGKILNLEHQKKDVDEVTEGKEAGLLVDASVAIAIGDRLIFTRISRK